MNSRPSFESKQNISFSQWYIGNKRRKRVVGEKKMAKNNKNEVLRELKEKGYGVHSMDDYVEREEKEKNTPEHEGIDSYE